MQRTPSYPPRKRKAGRPVKSGAWSVVNRDELVARYPEVQRFLRDTRQGLVRDVAGEEENLSEMQRILIDRIISKLAVCRVVECYLEKHGILRRDRLEKDKVLELEPALVQWAALDRNIKDALALLGIKKREAEVFLTVAEMAGAIKAERAENRPEVPQDEPNDKGENNGND